MELRIITPVSSYPGWTTRKPNITGAQPGGPDFTGQLQAVLQQTRTPQPDPAQTSRATVGHLHPGGMNDVVHQLLKLGGKG